MDEVGLVVIATNQRYICPIHVLLSMDMAQHILKSADAAKGFGGQPYLLVKELDEPPRAKADPVSHRSYVAAVR